MRGCSTLSACSRLIGRTDVPVVPGIVFPLVRSEKETPARFRSLRQSRLARQLGAKARTTLTPTANGMGPYESCQPHHPAVQSRQPLLHPAYARVRASHPAPRRRRRPLSHPPGSRSPAPGHHLCRRPLTNIALAVTPSTPTSPRSLQGLIVMGGSLDPQTSDPEFSATPRHEFNFWFDPEEPLLSPSARCVAAH